MAVDLEKTYEVFFRVSRAFGARDGNVWGALTSAKSFAERFGCEQGNPWAALGAHDHLGVPLKIGRYRENRVFGAFWRLGGYRGGWRWIFWAAAVWLSRGRYGTAFGHKRGGWGVRGRRITSRGQTAPGFLFW